MGRRGGQPYHIVGGSGDNHGRLARVHVLKVGVNALGTVAAEAG